MTASIFEIAARCWPSARGIPSFSSALTGKSNGSAQVVTEEL
jgi:hypothetical protein